MAKYTPSRTLPIQISGKSRGDNPVSRLVSRKCSRTKRVPHHFENRIREFFPSRPIFILNNRIPIPSRLVILYIVPIIFDFSVLGWVLSWKFYGGALNLQGAIILVVFFIK